jgi:DNA polymerase elongation subunit (family B)
MLELIFLSFNPDLKWYMHKQILPPVNRLCGPIKGTDLERLASCLGKYLDAFYL